MKVTVVSKKDFTKVVFDTEYIPLNTFLYKLLTEQTKVGIEKDDEGNILTSNSGDQLNILQKYLKTGQVEEDDLKSLFDLLLFYVNYKIQVPYDTEFFIIKLKEEWFRRNLYNPFFDKTNIQKQNYDLLNWTQLPKETFLLASHLPFLAYKTYIVYELRDEFWYHNTVNDHRSANNKIYILNFKQKQNQNISLKTLKSMFRTPEYNIFNIRDDIIEKKVEIAEKLFKERNDFYGKTLLYAKTYELASNVSITYTNINDHDNFYQNPSYQHELPNNFNWNNVVIAGGSVFKSLMKIQNMNDIDIFIYGLNSIEEYTEKLYEILGSFDRIFSVSITRNSFSFFDNNSQKYQIILRAYKTKSEIIHGFDVDSCCILYDGKDFLCTKRFVYALTDMVNTIDFDRMSPSYESRLRKYNKLGFSIHIPSFDYTKIKENITDRVSFFNRYKMTYKDYLKTNPKVAGIDLLLASFVSYYSAKISDYSPNYSNDLVISTYYYDENLNEVDKSIPVTLGFDREQTITLTYNIVKVSGQVVNYLIERRIVSTAKNYINIINKLKIPINWKVTQPGEQFTGTFHQTVHKDYRNWYPGVYYPTPK